MSTSNGDQFQRLLYVASCEVKTDPEFPARGSACGRAIRVKSGLGPGLTMVGNAARWSSGLRSTSESSLNGR